MAVALAAGFAAVARVRVVVARVVAGFAAAARVVRVVVALAGAAAAAVFVAVARDAVAVARLTGVAFGSFLEPPMTSLNVVPARKAGTLVFFTFTASPVRGLRAVRAARARFSNTPKPVMLTFSPLLTVRMMMSTRPSTAWAATFLSSPRRSDSASISWALFVIPVLHSGTHHGP